MNIKSNKRFLIVPCVLILVASICLVQIGFNSTVTKGTSADEAEIENVIKEMVLVTWDVGSYASETGRISDLSENGKKDYISDYKKKVEKVFSRNSINIQKRMEIRENILNSEAPLIANIMDCGIFNFRFNSLIVNAQKGTADVNLQAWQKSISQREEDGRFAVYFPICTDNWTIEIEKLEGEWKVLSYKLNKTEFDGDKEIEQIFDTYAEALAYAEKTAPRNIYESELE